MLRIESAEVVSTTTSLGRHPEDGHEQYARVHYILVEVAGELGSHPELKQTWLDSYMHKYQEMHTAEPSEKLLRLCERVKAAGVINPDHWYEGERRYTDIHAVPYWGTAEFAQRERAGTL